MNVLHRPQILIVTWHKAAHWTNYYHHREWVCEWVWEYRIALIPLDIYSWCVKYVHAAWILSCFFKKMQNILNVLQMIIIVQHGAQHDHHYNRNVKNSYDFYELELKTNSSSRKMSATRREYKMNRVRTSFIKFNWWLESCEFLFQRFCIPPRSYSIKIVKSCNADVWFSLFLLESRWMANATCNMQMKESGTKRIWTFSEEESRIEYTLYNEEEK